MRKQSVPVLHRYRLRKLRLKRVLYLLIGAATCLLLSIAIYFIPPVHQRLSWRLENAWSDIRFFLNPPEEALFVPTQQPQLDLIVTQTLAAMRIPTLTSTPSEPTPTPTITPTPLPPAVSLPVDVYVDQCYRWNYCGPANLAMALNFWGWSGTRDDVAAAIKPGVQDPNLQFYQQGETDKNVTTSEMVTFVNDDTQLRALQRFGGEIGLLKNLLVHGYPAVIEQGYYTYTSDGQYEWVGHYAFITGYDDARGGMIWQDTYPKSCPDGSSAAQREEWGRDNLASYAEFESGWRVFNNVFVLIYPSQKEAEVLSLLGLWAEKDWAAQHALDMMEEDIPLLSADDLYFAWFSKGTSLVALEQYQEAASAYDMAFQIYATLSSDDIGQPVPYRNMWYQDGPYWAYYYSGRFADVISLANTTLSTVRGAPTLEESVYWRALAEYALGDTVSAIEDMREVVRLKYNFQPAVDKLHEWVNNP